MTDHLFISSPNDVLRGDAARVALEDTNDTFYHTEGKGVLSVPPDRWQQAQAYERDTWLTHGLMLTEDRNAEHAANFGNYEVLPTHLGDVIELGCGPFTNWRLIQRNHTADDVTLLDPLADEYQAHHPHCSYRFGGEIDNRSYPVRWVNSAIENFVTKSKFDTVIMVNVLPHCFDIDGVFQWINSHLKRGGHLILGEPARDIDPAELYDVGHPLSFNQGVIDAFLKGYRAKFHNGDYFIGVKK